MKTEGWYNGYGWAERNAKLRALKRLLATGELPLAQGPCQLCGDPEVPVEYHDEDYSQPYLWGPPALFALCRNCHRDKLHKRFARPHGWLAFVAHVRRGGYARDLAEPELRREVAALAKALSIGKPPFGLSCRRAYASTVGQEWFANLSCDPIAVTPAAPRPRP
jgi:hypothetical protein